MTEAYNEDSSHNIIAFRTRAEVMRNSLLKTLGPTFTQGETAIEARLSRLAELISGLMQTKDVDAATLAALSEVAMRLVEANVEMVTAAHKAFFGTEG